GFWAPVCPNEKGTMFTWPPYTEKLLRSGLFCLGDHFKREIENDRPVQPDGGLVRAEPFDGTPFDIDEFSIDLVAFLVQGGSQVDVGHRSEQFVPGTGFGRYADLQLFDGIGRHGGLPYDFLLFMGPLFKVFR